jgi:S1-C subfamily serine protease
VIGVNSQIASEAASIAGSQPGSTGVGFAVFSDTVARAVKAIETGNGISSSSGTARSAQSVEGAQLERTQAPYGARTPNGAEGGEAEPGETGSNGTVEGTAGPGEDGGSGEGRIVIVP